MGSSEMLSAMRRAASRVTPAGSRSAYTPAAQNLDWGDMLFDYHQTRSHVRFTWKDGAWGPMEVHNDPNMSMHIMASVIHYGQALFEGLKAFQCADGKVRVFNSDANHTRLTNGSNQLLMPEISNEMFTQAVHAAVSDDLDYVPPYGAGGSLYIRPFLFGSGAKLGLGPSPEYTFGVMVNPVGAYYKGGLTGVDAMVVEEHDRAAPKGIGHVKAGGNYAADLLPSAKLKDAGYPIALYLDAKENKYVEEFSTSNFIGISQDGAYVTPSSGTILPSTTNQVLATLAEDAGIKVERRPVAYDELGSFKETGACGTAVVLTPVLSFTKGGVKTTVNDGAQGPILCSLYDKVRAVQQGEEEDKWGWTVVVE